MDFFGYIGQHSYVSMRKRGTHCIAPKLRGAHFDGSIIPRAKIDWKFAPQSLRAFKVRPAEFWSL